MEKVVSISEIIEVFDLEVLIEGLHIGKQILMPQVYRPGSELTGYIALGDTDIENSIHVIGKEEIKYINSLSRDVVEENLTHYLNYNFPCLIVTENIEIPEILITIAKIANKSILKSKEHIDGFIKNLREFLEKELAPEIIINKFSFIEVFGIGILITGDQSAKVGACIELLEKGHRYITDELLIIKKVSENVIVGENGYNRNKNEKNYFLKIHKGNKINVIEHFGIGATRSEKEIDLMIKFEAWNEKKFYDRLGIDNEKQFILGIEIPKLTIPVRKGRNLAIIVETAAINERLKKSGQNSALYFMEETQKLINANKKKSGGDKMNFIHSLDMEILKEKFNLKVLNGSEFLKNKKTFEAGIHRPSLEFSGFYDLLEEGGKNKIQLIGEAELKYLDRISKEKRSENLSRYLKYKFPAIILSGIETVPQYFMEKIIENKVVLLASKKNFSNLLIDFTEFLEIYFAPTITMHGVFVEIFGFGVLLTGKSGIGKSETALELIHRRHRLIADDMVKFTRYPDGRIIGTAEKVPYFMEVRGLGIIDVKTLYGLGAVRNNKQLDVIIELKEMKEENYLTKTDYNAEDINVLEEKISKVELYISSGRNAASMVEIATMNLRAKSLGYNSQEIYNNFKNIENLFNKK